MVGLYLNYNLHLSCFYRAVYRTNISILWVFLSTFNSCPEKFISPGKFLKFIFYKNFFKGDDEIIFVNWSYSRPKSEKNGFSIFKVPKELPKSYIFPRKLFLKVIFDLFTTILYPNTEFETLNFS